jgi:hypothetical protein
MVSKRQLAQSEKLARTYDQAQSRNSNRPGNTTESEYYESFEDSEDSDVPLVPHRHLLSGRGMVIPDPFGRQSVRLFIITYPSTSEALLIFHTG